MEFTLTKEQEEFRAAVCAFLSQERVTAVVEQARALPPRTEPGLIDVYRWLGERGWLAVNWPVEYGGLGRGVVEKSLLTEELIKHEVPDLVHIVSIDIIGQILQLVGTEEQRARLLPPLARGEQSASVLYTEPQAGSDLGALETRAIPDGDGWRLYGRKVYSLKSQFADFALCAARTTDSAVQIHGITLFIVPMRTPGCTVRLLPNMSDEAFCDVTLDGIRVGPLDVIGNVDEGWQMMNQVLPVERTGLEFQAKAKRLLGQLVRHAKETGLLDDPVYASRLVELYTEVEAAHLLAWRVIRDLDAGRLDGLSTAESKWYSTELFKKIARFGGDLLGLDGTLTRWDAEPVCGGRLEAADREGPGITLSAGTSEIMRYLIASAGLKLLG